MVTTRSRTITVIGITLLILVGVGVLRWFPDSASKLLRGRLAAPGNYVEAAGVRLNQPALVTAIYEEANFRPLWTDAGALRPKAKTLLKFIRAARSRNFGDGDYHLERIATLLEKLPKGGGSERLERRVDLDLLLTDAYVWFGRSVHQGAVDPRTVYPDWFQFPPRQGTDEAVQAAFRSNDFASALNSLEPLNPYYVRMRQGLDHYRRIKEAGGWPIVPDGPPLLLGARSERVPILRKRLQITGELEGTVSVTTDACDAELVAAVTKFQERHGLPANGQLDAPTLDELNERVEKQIRKMELNLERMRWLPPGLDDRHIFVNVASSKLELVDKSQVIMRKRVMVGSMGHWTVLFTGAVSSIELNPYWEVPKKSIAAELIPQLKLKKLCLATEGIHIFDGYDAPKEIMPEEIDWATVDPATFPYRFRQDPGPTNPLGCIKFMFPNPYCIFVHDTVKRELFERNNRRFSHGCIRLEHPLELAEHLLAGSAEWNRASLQSAIDTKSHQIIPLPNPTTIYLYYLTSWADTEGVVHFCEDIYHVDRELGSAITQAQSESTDGVEK